MINTYLKPGLWSIILHNKSFHWYTGLWIKIYSTQCKTITVWITCWLHNITLLTILQYICSFLCTPFSMQCNHAILSHHGIRVLSWNPLASSIINQYTHPSVTLYSSSSKEKYPFLCLSILINCNFNGIICGGLPHQSRCPVHVIPMALTE